MMKLPKPLGLYPKLASDALPAGGATIATNVNVTAGGVFPLVSAATPDNMYDTTTSKMKTGIAVADIVGPAKPTSKPALASCVPLCVPLASGGTAWGGGGGGWLTIYANAFASYINPSDGQQYYYQSGVDSTSAITLTNPSIVYTPTGFEIHATLSGWDVGMTTQGGMTPPVETAIHGPVFQFSFTGGSTGEGGPHQTIEFPADASIAISNSVTPEFNLPLYVDSDDTKRQYGTLSCMGASGAPIWDQILPAPLPLAANTLFDGGEVIFSFECRYNDPLTEHLYMLAHVDESKREGPPSELSDMIRVPPGHKLTLTLDAPVTSGSRYLYRAGAGSQDFRRSAEITGTATSWTDTGDPFTSIPLPPFGAFTDFGFANTDSDKAEFVEGSFVTPAGVGVAVVNDKTVSGATHKNLVIASDYNRLHCWDKLFSCDMGSSTGLVLAQVGAGALLFSTGSGKIFNLSCGSPEQIASGAGLLSSSHPLLDKRSLCRIGDTVYWVTNEGLAASGGGTPQIVTKEQYDAAAWGALTPSNLKCRTVGHWILIEQITASTPAVNLLYDLNTGQVVNWLGTWTTSLSTSGGTIYQTGQIVHDAPVYYDFIRAILGADVLLDVTIDGTAQTQKSLTAATQSGKFVSLAMGPGRVWQFKFTQATQTAGLGVHFPVELIERRIHEAGESITLTPAMVDNPGDMWVKTADVDRPAVGILALPVTSMGTAQSPVATLTVMQRDGTTAPAGSTNGDNIIPIYAGVPFYFPRAWSKTDLLRYALTDSTGTPLAPFSKPWDSLTILNRRTVEAGATIHEVNAGGNVAQWRRKVYKPVNLSYLQAVVIRHHKPSSGTVTMNVYLDGATTAATITELQSVTASAGAIVLTIPRAYSTLEFDFGADDQYVDEVIGLSQRVVERGMDIEHTVQPGEIPSFLSEVSKVSRQLISGRLVIDPEPATGASRYPVTLNFFKDKQVTGTPDCSIIVRSASEFPIWDAAQGDQTGALGLAQFVQVSTSNNAAVRSIQLWGRRVEEVGPGGVTLPGPFPLRRRFCHFGAPGRFALATISAPALSSAAVALSVDGAAASVTNLTVATPTYLPRALAEGSLVEVNVINTGFIDALDLIPERRIPGQLTQQFLRREGALQTWQGAVVDYSGVVDLISAVAWFPGSQALSIYANGAATPTWTSGALVSGVEFLIIDENGNNPLVGISDAHYRFTDDQTVTEWWMFCRDPIKHGAEGWRAADTAGRKNYRGLELEFTKTPGAFVVASVEATDYTDLILEVTPEGGTGSGAIAVANSADFRLGALGVARRHVLDLVRSAACDIDALRLHARMKFTLKGGLVTIEASGDPWTWLARTVITERPMRLSCILVKAEAYPVTVTIYPGGYPNSPVAVSVTSAKMQWVPVMRLEREIEIDAVAPAGARIDKLMAATGPGLLR